MSAEQEVNNDQSDPEPSAPIQEASYSAINMKSNEPCPWQSGDDQYQTNTEP